MPLRDGNRVRGGGGAPSPSSFTNPEEALMQAALSGDPNQVAMRWRSSKAQAKDAAAAAAAKDGSVVKEGFLTKKGHVMRTQKERYFVLRQHTLSYFRAKWSEKKSKPAMLPSSLKGVLELTASDIITPAPHSDQWFRIQKLPDAEGKFYKLDLKASNAAERQEWIDALRGVCRNTLLLKQQAMHAASVRLHLNRATTIRHGRDSTILSARMDAFASFVGTMIAEDAKAASMADMRTSFMILHELVLLQKLVERIKSTWGPPAKWTCEQYQELVQSIYLAQEKSGSSQLQENSILAEAFQLRYQFEEIPENQPKIRQIQDAQQKDGDAVLGAASATTREASNSVTLPPTPPRLRCPTIYGYYSTFEQLTIGASDGSSPRGSTDGRSSSAAAPLTPRSATIAKYAHLYLEDDVRAKKPWSWNRSDGDDLLEGWKSGGDLDTARIVQELCDRFSHDRIYTYINDHTMVLFNPHRILQTSKFTSIYDEQVVLTYAMTPYVHTQLAPHPFAMAKQGLLRLFYNLRGVAVGGEKKDASLSKLPTQTLFLSGESGSGKTELAKELLKYYVLSAQPTSSATRSSRPKVKLFTSSTKSTTQMRTEETRTMALLEAKGVDHYEIVLLDLYPERWSEMTSVSKSKRIPQVHIDGLFFGFYEKLESLEDEEQLRMYFKNPRAARKLSTVLDSNILLEAFGNATTSMNLNSSRFGKATTLYFSFDRHPSEYQVLGCCLVPFLLEKSRVTSMKGDAVKGGTSESNFHVFYALVSGVNAVPYMRLLAKDLRLDSTTSETFVYLGKCKHKLQGAWTEDETWKKDVERWQHVLDAMNSMGLSADQQRAIFQVLSAILWLGNVDFEWNNKAKKLEMVSPSNQHAETNVVALLGLESVAQLENMLFTKHIELASTGESFDIALEKGQVAHLRDTLARLLYQVVFHYLVAQMNEVTKVDSVVLEADATSDKLRALKLVDVFGFENLDRNSLEQLCINYLSEKLFAAEEQAIRAHYGSTELPASSAEKGDNVLFLFEHPLGIFASLEELTVLHQGENENWQQEQKKNQLLVRNLYERNAARLLDPPRIVGVNGKLKDDALPFSIPHSREAVVYDASEFVKKNSDFQHLRLVEGLEKSSNAQLRKMLASLKDTVSSTYPHKNKRASTTSGSGSQVNQFRAQTQALTTQDDNDVMPLHMHCIRPNSTGRPSHIEPEVVEGQLTSHRLLSQLRLCGEALEGSTTAPSYFSLKVPKQFFLKRYLCLLPRQSGEAEHAMMSDEDLQQQLLKLLLADEDRLCQGARWNVEISSESLLLFPSAEMVEKLDLLLEIRQSQATIIIQSFARMIKDRGTFLMKQSERKSLKNELIEIYGADNVRKVEKILTRYQSNEDELRAKIAEKKKIVHQEHVQMEQLERDLKSLCLSSEGGLKAETVNELLSDTKICSLLQQNESIVAALRDMSLDPGVLTSQLANPILRSFYQDLVSVLKEKKVAALELARSKQVEKEWSPQLSIEDRVQNMVAGGRERWKAAAVHEEWSEYQDKLEEIGDEPEMLVFHLEDAGFVAVLEDFVTKLEVQQARDDQEAALVARMQEDATKSQAHAAEVEMELLEMLLKVELDESLMAAMHEDPFFIQALENPVLISSMQQFAVNRQGLASHGGLQNPAVREFFLKLINLSLIAQEQES